MTTIARTPHTLPPTAPRPQMPTAPVASTAAPMLGVSRAHESPASEPLTQAATAPLLLLFTSKTDGRGRRMEGFISHLMQRRGNHDAFRLRVINAEERPDLVERFRVAQLPTVLVVEDQRVVARMMGYVRPNQLHGELAPWLR